MQQHAAAATAARRAETERPRRLLMRLEYDSRAPLSTCLRKTRQDLRRALCARRMNAVESKRPHPGEELHRAVHRVGIGLAEHTGRVAVGFELLALTDGGDVALAGSEGAAGVPEPHMPVLVRHGERGELGPDPLH